MEFCEKLQKLRKEKGLTQEELAQRLYVSRTAVSKWESGRGYPNLDSLKDIAKFYNVTIDELLSGEELLTVAKEDNRRKINNFRSVFFGLLDVSMVLLLFLPLLAQRIDGKVYEVSLWQWKGTSYLRVGYYLLTVGMVVLGALQLLLQKCQSTFWSAYKHKLSLICSMLGVLLFISTLQAYAAVLLLAFLIIKVFSLIKWQ